MKPPFGQSLLLLVFPWAFVAAILIISNHTDRFWSLLDRDSFIIMGCVLGALFQLAITEGLFHISRLMKPMRGSEAWKEQQKKDPLGLIDDDK